LVVIHSLPRRVDPYGPNKIEKENQDHEQQEQW
jgi:hypothetical protein